MQCDKMLFCLNFVAVFVIFICHTGLSQVVPPAPPLEFPSDNKTYKIYHGNSPQISDTPPHIFPENGPNHKVIKNNTIAKYLTSDSTKVDTEVSDLNIPALQHGNTTALKNDSSSTTQTSASTPTTEDKKSLQETSSTESSPELDAEDIESDLSKTEDVKLNSTLAAVSKIKEHQEHDHTVRGSGPVLQGQLAAVLAAVFALIAVASYIGLLTWRRYLEHRYGNREMLINEDDPINYNDMKNFEL